ncbi:unnamed protein product [Amoebophrya sp. A120]|nr:unnamed protein product [Amoebophrya sp. A120]|eukprot:GSA120T00017359001.1
MDISDLEHRKECVGEQIRALKTLNDRFGTAFQNLSAAMAHGDKEKRGPLRLSAGEFRSYENVNRRANAAKHENLGADGVGEIPRFRSNWTETAKKASAAPDPEGLGNCKGALETAYSKFIGRPLRKNEPRYRWVHRPHNQGPFTAICCLDHLEEPVELFGDTYTFKKTAEHSAARQALHHIQTLEPKRSAPVAKEALNRPESVLTTKEQVTTERTGAAIKPTADRGVDDQSRSQRGSRDQEVEVKKHAAPTPSVPEPQPVVDDVDSLMDAISKMNLRDSTAERKPEYPPNEAVIRVLREAQGPLRLRVIYLLALGHDPKTAQMGGGVRAGFVKQLKGMQQKGLLVHSGDDSWRAS